MLARAPGPTARRTALLAALLGTVLVSCEARPDSSALTAGVAGSPGGEASSTPPSPPPPEASAARRAGAGPAMLVSATAVEPTGRLPVDPASETVVDPGASFEVVLAARFADARLVLLDAQESQVTARGTTEVAERTTLTLTPARPLTPASRYALRVEGAVERTLHDAAGRAIEPISFALLVAGTPPPPEPPRRSRRRRR